jgi:VWFA-related protein
MTKSKRTAWSHRLCHRATETRRGTYNDHRRRLFTLYLLRVSVVLWLAQCLIAFGGVFTVKAQEAARPSVQTQKPRTSDQGATVRIGSEEVLLDVVARDKRGRPVTDLKADEIEVYEDGVKQQINSFRKVEKTDLIEGAGAPNNTPGATPANAVDPLRQINLVTMVFERLNNEGRRLARDAAVEFLKSELRRNVMVAVFALDQRLQVLQQFTNDGAKLNAAVDRATGGASSQFAGQSEAIQRELENLLRAQSNLEAASGAGVGQAMVEAKLAEVTTNMLRQTDDAQREQQAASSVFSLISLIRGQQRLAGRKTVLYFSEGLQLTPNLAPVFRNAVGAANRANVSFYAIDARGLQTSRQTDAARESLAAAARANEQQLRSRGAQPVTPEQIKAMDNAESSILKNAQQNLASLAESTGGFLVANTNDLRSPMRRVAAELSSYYEISYVPQFREYDGKFRALAVKTSREDVVLQTRSGYFALPPNEGGGPNLQGFEAPMLAALGSPKPPRDFDYRATAMRFASNADGTQYALIIEAPLANLTLSVDQDKKIYRTHFAMMALLKNAGGQVVQKFSQDYPLEGPIDRLEALKRGNVVFVRNFHLAPGRYTLETAAHDREANRISARRAVVVVPAAGQGVSMSSIAVIKRIDPVDPNVKDPDNPLRFEQGKIIPNLGEAIQQKQGSQVSFFFVVYPAPGLNEKPGLSLEFLLDGQQIARATPELSQPNAQGRIAYIASAPTETFKAGRYELRAVVTHGQQAVEEHAFFVIE